MKAAEIVDREELREQLRAHAGRECDQLAEELSGVLAELVEARDPLSFEQKFAKAIRAFGAGLMGEGLRRIEPAVKAEVKRGATN